MANSVLCLVIVGAVAAVYVPIARGLITEYRRLVPVAQRRRVGTWHRPDRSESPFRPVCLAEARRFLGVVTTCTRKL